MIEQETIAYQLQALAITAAKLRNRIAREDQDKPSAARACSTLDELSSWAEDEAERRR